ncbi:lipid IV(A) 3-deoxy-D-manno-octulosonic acid transferase [Vibrio plantisponsor]|uniref:3-deoxy-D-manno-octulosonic acid transferase n=1 Tax=Vibrio plantisponsor TaxID=664643 RepID=A0ABU4IJ80_9VIBR|nr:lipid IV(A) 3-deoxy-D-manno-octulosonic acid transferase [Vibrio plantisponsor]MDW6018324.1 lipid IV(A) 3-deoxy-D-manno-octulosonic acid transferase [Vibrio plantisponsor]NNM41871.1 3-deoxy-D-manno-octulosonic acid transferase [Vibrio plantisponsor]
MLIRYIYTALLAVASPFLMWGLYRHRTGKPCVGKRWKEHFGVTPKLDCSHGPIWIHAVSVGETLAVTPLIKRLKAQYPHLRIVITTTTATGAEQAQKLAGIAEHRYMPFDFPFAVRGFINAIKPRQLLIMETELWPNTLHTVAKANIPITVINARLSELSCQRYAKVQPIFDMLAKNLTQVLCQYPDDAERFIRLGVAKEKVSVTGSIKFDIEISPKVKEEGQALRNQLGNNRPVWIAASTHSGEDEQILSAHQEVLKDHPNALLILVPRHPERFNDVFNLSKQKFNTVRRTEHNHRLLDNDIQVYLGDTMGEMLTLMEAADICFMGGSLLGDKVGGHNMLEPAALGKPVLTGPSYYNFSEVVNSMRKNKAITIVKSNHDIAPCVTKIMNKDETYYQQKSHIEKYINNNKGAVNKILSIIK